MATKFTRSVVLTLNPCDLSRVPEFGDLDHMGVSISDLLWIAGARGMKRQCVQFALECAQRVAHLNPDPRVQGALDAAGAWLADPSDENRQETAKAAEAAEAAWEAARAQKAASNAAAWAAWTAGTAAWTAAWAARTAAEAAAEEAAEAAANAAVMAVEAADLRAAEVDAQRETFLRIFDRGDTQ